MLFLVVTNVHAQSNKKLKAKAYLDKGDAILTNGDNHMSEDNVEEAIEAYEKALALYEKAYATFESPKIYFPIALTEQKLGRYKLALKHYKLLLSSEVELSKDVKKQVADGVQISKSNLVGFWPTVKPDGATIYLDGKKMGITPLPEIVYVTPGWHEFKIRKTGYKTFEGDFDRKRGVLEKRDISLKKGGGVATDNKGDPRPSDGNNDKRVNKVPLWLGLGATVVLAGTATYTGLRALEEQNNANDPTLSDIERKEIKDNEFRLAVTTDALIAGAAIAGGLTLYYYFAKIRPGAKERNVVVSPYIGQESGGWMVRGAF